MKELKALWAYQAAENDLDEYEKVLKNTATRKKLVRQKEVFEKNQAHLRRLEQGSVLQQNALVEITGQIDSLRKQMVDKDAEIREIEGYDLEDLFPEDVHEMMRECESIRTALDASRRKVVDIMRQLEETQNDAQETLVRMSRAKKAFDQLKDMCNKEMESCRGDLDKRRRIVSAAAKNVPAELLTQYRSIKQHRPNPVVYLKDKRCQGCNMEVPSSALQEIRSTDHIVVCENCGRILMTFEEEETTTDKS